MKSVLWKVEKCLSYIEDARCLKVKKGLRNNGHDMYGGSARNNKTKHTKIGENK